MTLRSTFLVLAAAALPLAAQPLAAQTPAAPAPAAKPITDLPAFYADLVNSDRYLPVSAISNTMRDAMLARGLVTAERLRERGVR